MRARLFLKYRQPLFAGITAVLLGLGVLAVAAPNPGTLFVDSYPGPAHVYLNGKYQGLTPFTLKTTPGKYQLTLKKQDYTQEQVSVEVRTGKVTKVDAQLTPAGDWAERPIAKVPLKRQRGTLTVLSDRQAEVWLDGKMAKHRAPLTLEGVSAGAHTLTLRFKGREETRKLVVNPGGVDKLTVNFGDAPMPPSNVIGQRDWSYPIAGGTCVQGPCGPGMCYVPSGEFFMGCSQVDTQCEADERPYHRVMVDAFCIDQKETSNPYGSRQGLSWHDAARLCQSFNKRLPTEAEWEKAARGPYGQISPAGRYAVPDKAYTGPRTKDGNPPRPNPWPQYGYSKMSPFGLLNTADGLWEWTQDWYSPTYYQDALLYNPKGPAFGKAVVLRGGAFNETGQPTRASFRYYMEPEKALNTFGARCAASVVGEGH